MAMVNWAGNEAGGLRESVLPHTIIHLDHKTGIFTFKLPELVFKWYYLEKMLIPGSRGVTEDE